MNDTELLALVEGLEVDDVGRLWRLLPNRLPPSELQVKHLEARGIAIPASMAEASVLNQWSDAEEARLRSMSEAGSTLAQMAEALKRTEGAIKSRLKKLELPIALTYLQQRKAHLTSLRRNGVSL